MGKKQTGNNQNKQSSNKTKAKTKNTAGKNPYENNREVQSDSNEDYSNLRKKMKTETETKSAASDQKIAVRKSETVDKDHSILDHLAYLLQGKGECTAVSYSVDSEKLIVAANMIRSITQVSNELLEYITDVLDFFHTFANKKSKETIAKQKQDTFLKICKALLNSLQKDDPYKYLVDIEKEKLDNFIEDFYNKTGVAKNLAKALSGLKKDYGNDIAQQISKVGYTINKVKHSFNKVISNIENKSSKLHKILKKDQNSYDILKDCDELSLVKMFYNTLTEQANSQDNKVLNDIIIALKRHKDTKNASELSMHVHAEMKILDKVLPEYLKKTQETKSNNIYIGSSKLFCYDCHLMQETIFWERFRNFFCC